jgi:hypothetical protein
MILNHELREITFKNNEEVQRVKGIMRRAAEDGHIKVEIPHVFDDDLKVIISYLECEGCRIHYNERSEILIVWWS